VSGSTDPTFYVYAWKPVPNSPEVPDYSSAIACKYLMVNGSYVVDPLAGGSSSINLYSQLNSDGTINSASQFQNTNNYLGRDFMKWNRF